MNDKNRQILLQNGTMLSDQSNQIDQIISTLEQTSETANATAQKLKEQDQKIINIGNTNKEISKENRRADRTINTITRREFTHKMVLYIVALLLFVSIITVIIVKVGK